MISSKQTILEKMAEYVFSVHYEDLPTEVIDEAKTCILDAFECCLSAIDDTRKQGAMWITRKNVNGCGSTLFGAEGLATAEDAAFYNVVTGSISARNEITMNAHGHCGTVIIPSAIAIGEETNCDGKTLLESIVASYETTIRLGKIVKESKSISNSYRRGTFNVSFGSSIASAKVLKLEAQAIANAAALSLNFFSGLNEWRNAGTGEDVFQNGFMVRAGISSARLAAAGVQGSFGNYDGGFGILSILNETEKASELIESLGDYYHILGTKHKPVGACISLQGPCQIAEQFAKIDGIKEKDIEEIIVQVPERQMRLPWYAKNSELDNPVFATMSIPFVLSATIVSGSMASIDWLPPYSDSVNNLMMKCHLICDEYSKEHLGSSGYRVTIRLHNGKEFSREQHGFEPLDKGQVEQRFIETATKKLVSTNVEEIIKRVQSLENLKSITELTSLLRVM